MKLTKKSPTNNYVAVMPNKHPIPKNGRYFYKLKLNAVAKPNVLIGVIGRNIVNESIINKGDPDGLTYFSNGSGTEQFYTG